MVYWARMAYLVVAWLFVAAVLSQIFLAGLSLFALAANWGAHQEFGYGISFLALLLVVLAFPGRIPRAIVRWLALHPLNALAVFWIALTHARRARVELVMPQPGNNPGQAAQRRQVNI
jgi:hypothetical protein